MNLFEKSSPRKKFQSLLVQEISRARKKNAALGIINIQLTRLRDINQEYGYDFADQVLELLQDLIKKNLRTQDHLVWTGDRDFSVILGNTHGVGDNILFANKLLNHLSEPVKVGDNLFRLRVQIGMASFPENAVDAEELMKYADAATIIAGNTPDKYYCYEAVGDLDTTTMFAMEDELEKAISAGEVQYHYQPKADIKTGVIAGFEVLSRWNSKKWGFVRPDMFINAAERSNLIADLTMDSLTKTFKEFTELQAVCDNPAITLSVNLSAKILNNAESIERVINTVNIWCERPENLVLEITEGAIMTDPEAARDVLNQLHENGIQISIDDFGTGYSSLSYLKKLPVDELKIDKSFVKDLLQNEDDVMIVQTIIDLARNFHLNIVAEGTETKDVIIKLREMGCHAAQGYYIAKPIPYEQLPGWVGAWDPARIL